MDRVVKRLLLRAVNSLSEEIRERDVRVAKLQVRLVEPHSKCVRESACTAEAQSHKK